MPSGAKITPEAEDKILQLRNQGITLKEISSNLGISSSPIRRVLHPEAYKKWLTRQRGNPKSQGVTVSEGLKARALELSVQGKTHLGIMQELSIGRKCLRRILNPESLERAHEKQKQLHATTARVEIGGRKIRIKVGRKNPRPNVCELCHKTKGPQGINWHHWDDNHPGIGLWLCNFPCHGFAEGVDVGLKAEDYLRLKDQANKGELK